MAQLPLISSRSGARSVAKQPSKELSYTQRFHIATKVTNYENMSESQIWKEYEKLRECLKVLNQDVMDEMEKRESIMRKSGKHRVNTETTRLVQQECKNAQQALRLSTMQLQSLKVKLEYFGKIDIKALEEQHIKLKCCLKDLKAGIKYMRTKTFMLSKNLTKGPSIFQAIAMSNEQLNYLQRTTERQKTRLAQSEEMLANCVEKIEEIDRTSDTRLQQCKQLQQQSRKLDNIKVYRQLCFVKQKLNKEGSPLKKTYLSKLKELDGMLETIASEDERIQSAQFRILNIRNQIDGVESRTVQMRNQLKKSDFRINSMLEMSSTEDVKQISDNSKSFEDKCF